jgi:hypothetical protein
MQGFLFSRAVPAAEATVLLGQHFVTPASARAVGA